jgi:succinoglycan biosynthesis transport protein ExoP
MAFQGSGIAPAPADDFQEEHRQRVRRRVFSLAFVATLVIGLVYTLLQPRLYQSSATVLMSAPTAIDEQMLDADVQGVAIQRRVLLSSEITTRLAARLRREHGFDLDSGDLRDLLSVAAVPETNLLELRVTSSTRDLPPVLAEAWIAEYAQTRAGEIETRKARTLREVEDELASLALRLSDARAALAAYRAEHEIISPEREQNAVLSRLDGLNEALNEAAQEEVRSRAYLDALRRSLAAGEPALPESERAEVAAMGTQLAELRADLAEARARYTDEYIRKDPRLRDISQQIEELESAIGHAYGEGSEAELANAERAWETARASVAELERRLEAHKQDVLAFNTVYAEHEALVEDLAALEELNRLSQARLAQVSATPTERYPQLAVIDEPAAQAVRVGPDYLLLLGASIGAAFAAGIFAAWLYGYLNPRRQQPGYVTLSGVHMYPTDPAQLGASDTQRLERLGDGQLNSDPN